MRFAAIASAFFGLAACVSADTITVIVAKGGLIYSPTNVTANAGDVLNFQFPSGNHTATQSTFDDPCTPSANGIDSGFNPATGSGTTPSFNVTVNSTDPLWFFCATPGHCKAGMVFAVNPPSNETFDDFKAKATGSSSNSSSSGPSSTKSATPSASSKSSSDATLSFNTPWLAGITLVAVLAGSVF